MSEQPRGILQAVGRRLDDTRDLLEAAMEQATALERSLRDHERRPSRRAGIRSQPGSPNGNWSLYILPAVND